MYHLGVLQVLHYRFSDGSRGRGGGAIAPPTGHLRGTKAVTSPPYFSLKFVMVSFSVNIFSKVKWKTIHIINFTNNIDTVIISARITGGMGELSPTTYRRPRYYNSATYGIPPLKKWNEHWKNIPFPSLPPPSTFLLIRALVIIYYNDIKEELVSVCLPLMTHGQWHCAK